MTLKIASRLCIILILMSATTYGFDSNSNYQLAEPSIISTDSLNYKLHYKNVIRDGKAYDIDLIPSGNGHFEEPTKPPLNKCFSRAPQESWEINRFANLNYPKPPTDPKIISGVSSVISWLTAVNYGTTFGYVDVKRLELYAVDSLGKERKVASKLICKDCDNKVWGYHRPKSHYINVMAKMGAAETLTFGHFSAKMWILALNSRYYLITV